MTKFVIVLFVLVVGAYATKQEENELLRDNFVNQLEKTEKVMVEKKQIAGRRGPQIRFEIKSLAKTKAMMTLISRNEKYISGPFATILDVIENILGESGILPADNKLYALLEDYIEKVVTLTVSLIRNIRDDIRDTDVDWHAITHQTVLKLVEIASDATSNGNYHEKKLGMARINASRILVESTKIILDAKDEQSRITPPVYNIILDVIKEVVGILSTSPKSTSLYTYKKYASIVAGITDALKGYIEKREIRIFVANLFDAASSILVDMTSSNTEHLVHDMKNIGVFRFILEKTNVIIDVEDLGPDYANTAVTSILEDISEILRSFEHLQLKIELRVFLLNNFIPIMKVLSSYTHRKPVNEFAEEILKIAAAMLSVEINDSNVQFSLVKIANTIVASIRSFYMMMDSNSIPHVFVEVSFIKIINFVYPKMTSRKAPLAELDIYLIRNLAARLVKAMYAYSENGSVIKLIIEVLKTAEDSINHEFMLSTENLELIIDLIDTAKSILMISFKEINVFEDLLMKLSLFSEYLSGTELHVIVIQKYKEEMNVEFLKAHTKLDEYEYVNRKE